MTPCRSGAVSGSSARCYTAVILQKPVFNQQTCSKGCSIRITTIFSSLHTTSIKMKKMKGIKKKIRCLFCCFGQIETFGFIFCKMWIWVTPTLVPPASLGSCFFFHGALKPASQFTVETTLVSIYLALDKHGKPGTVVP